jgi:hypothetical protein
MATLLLTAAAGAASNALGLGTLASTALGLGAAIGGRFIDQALFGPGPQPSRHQEGPRLETVTITASTEGAAITRLYGRSRLGGQIVWATRLEEEAVTTTQTTGGGKGGGGRRATTTTTGFRYFGNFAVGLAEGEAARIGRIWADGRELDQDGIAVRAYLGNETQQPDSLIEAKEGEGQAPAYRGLAYLVFERLPLEEFGNRIPQITAEVFRPVGALEGRVRGVALIPGTTEFGYEPDAVRRLTSPGRAETENRHNLVARSDWSASMDLLADLAPECAAASLVVAWFGSDLRCGECEIKPKVENASKQTDRDWTAGGLTRANAEIVSQFEGRPAFGGAPDDASVVNAIQDLKERGLAVMFYPFIMMDVPPGNVLPDPYSDNAGAAGQPAYPWRGRIACSPAPGFAGSPDKQAAAGTQVDAFVNRTWGYRNFILHMAGLCAQAGGVDAFCIGSEMVGLTRVRDGAASYPFVQALTALAGEVRAILGPGTKIGYAADWSEYHSHRPDDGSGDVLFNMDPLWAAAEIDFVGIDNYLPLSDWRDGSGHLDFDAANGPTTIYDQSYLKANIEGGEHYDFFYASEADRAAQARTAIADSAHGEPWVFRNKDIRNWWLNAHHDRPGGERSGASSAWLPQSKPVWFTELGIPAVDKGTNQPNVFHDPKSSESFFPHFSSGPRDDAIQRAGLEAVIDYWQDAADDSVSTVYGGPMIDPARIFIWAWDARMAPSFPEDSSLWADAENWDRGHWISGRLGTAPAKETVERIFAEYGFQDGLVEPIGSVVEALIADRVLSARQLLEAAAAIHHFDAVESQGKIRVHGRIGQTALATINAGDLLETGPSAGSGQGPGDRYVETRAQETELPDVVKLTYGEPASDDQPGAVEARRLTGASRRTVQHQLPAVMPEGKARAIAEIMLHEAWVGREGLAFGLPPSLLRLDPGDVIAFAPTGEAFRIAEIADAEARQLRAIRTDPALFGGVDAPRRSRPLASVSALAKPVSVFLDGPLLADEHVAHAGYVAAFASPWPGGVALWRSPAAEGYRLDQVLSRPATIGRTAFDFFSGPVWRWDRGNELWVDLFGGTVSSADELQVLNGANALAVENGDGEWEVVQFRDAELMNAGRYRLRTLLRGQRGSEHAMRNPVAAGARVLVLDLAVSQPAIGTSEIGLPLSWTIGPASREIGDESYDTQTVTLLGRGRRPLSPAHVTGSRDFASGDVTLSWTRRTRLGGDSWEQVEVPLGEDAEAYEIDVLSGGGAVLRTLSATFPSVVYSAAQQSVDFGSPPSSFDVIVHQLSASYGRGLGTRKIVHV